MFTTTRKRLKAISINKKLLLEYLGGDLQDKNTVIERFLNHEKKVKRLIPPDQLLIYNVKEGWKPITDFLSLPVPSLSFPNTNSKDQFLNRRKGLN